MSSPHDVRPEDYRFCPKCGGSLHFRKLDGRTHEPERHVCGSCDFVFFLNPKIAAGAMFQSDSGLVLLRRAIEPGYGKWVFPGGFVDRGETVEHAAIRETREEASVEVRIRDLLGVFSYHGAPVVVVVYAAEIVGGTLAAADETLEARVFGPGEIPWDDLAFPSTRDAVEAYVRKHFRPR